MELSSNNHCVTSTHFSSVFMFIPLIDIDRSPIIRIYACTKKWLSVLYVAASSSLFSPTSILTAPWNYHISWQVEEQPPVHTWACHAPVEVQRLRKSSEALIRCSIPAGLFLSFCSTSPLKPKPLRFRSRGPSTREQGGESEMLPVGRFPSWIPWWSTHRWWRWLDSKVVGSGNSMASGKHH